MTVKPTGGSDKRVQLAGRIQRFLERTQYVRMPFYNGTYRELLLASMTSPYRSGDEALVIPDTHADWRFAKNVK
jgi:hypothetical protein